jgi:TonB family protein
MVRGSGAIIAGLMLAACPATGQAQSTRTQEPEFISSLVDVFNPNAYPVEALQNQEQGRTVVSIEVDAHGTATSCALIETSGSTSLDTETCMRAMTIRFRPARSGDRAVSGRKILPVRWKLPPMENQRIITFSMVAGSVRCTVGWYKRTRRMRQEACETLVAMLNKLSIPPTQVIMPLPMDLVE